MKKIAKTRILSCILALLLIPAFIVTLFAGCTDPDATAETYTVTVVNGTIQGGEESGEFEEGASVTVVATVPSGKVFKEWTSDGETVSTANPYTFTVSADVTLTAVFENASVTKTHTVTVVNGTIQGGEESGEFTEGASVTVVATVPSGQEFVGWAVGDETVSTANPYTFTVSADVTLTAVLQAKQPIPAEGEGDPVALQKSTGGNPIAGFGVGDETFDRDWTSSDTDKIWQEGDENFADVLTYGGDPAVMVVKDPDTNVETAYLYVGHDVTEQKLTSAYTMPEWICYSSTDLIHWKTESIILDIEDVPYAATSYDSAWASQVIEYEGYYWFLFCTYTNREVLTGENGQQCIGLAVSDSPTGPFECFNTPLVYSSWTNMSDNGVDAKDAGWNDIDPTAWVTSEGEMYVAWGNSHSFMCQVEMVNSTDNGTKYNVELEIVDQSVKHDTSEIQTTDDPSFYWFGYNGIEETADIMRIDLYTQNSANNTFTEAPYLYARDTDGDGHEDRYYMFYAAGWREALAYSYVDVDSPDGLWEDVWTYGNRLMDPTSTSNTNHPAIFDFGGKTYMIYHNGSLPYGCGYRRVANITELTFSDTGFVQFAYENSTGLDGVNTKITQNDIPIGHLYTVNSHNDMYYPIDLPTFWKAASSFEHEADALWELELPKFVPQGESAANYISIQAYNMAGLYLTYDIETGRVYITQDDEKEGTPKSDAQQKCMTFKTLSGENGVGVMFQCVADTNYYLAIVGGELVVTDGATAAQRTFRVQTQTANGSGLYNYNEGAAAA